jgi:hypothetical protein
VGWDRLLIGGRVRLRLRAGDGGGGTIEVVGQTGQVRRIIFAAAVALALSLVLPVWAAAATVSVRVSAGIYPRVPPQTKVEYRAAPGEISDLVVRAEGADLVRLRDSRSPISPGPGCAAVSANEATCATPVGSLPITEVAVYLGDGADRAAIGTGVPAWVLGGGGDDTIDARADGHATLSGGPGRDSLAGGRGRDGLYGGSGPDTLRGGGGSDVLDGDGRGSSATGGADLASDVMNGGRGVDAVNYRQHPVAVRVDLALGRGGARGERDVLAGIENVRGSDGADVLLGDAGPNVLNGFDSPSSGPGDRVVGRAGNDQLPTGDRFVGGPGRDYIFADGDEAADCGAGRDLVDMTYTVFTEDGRPRYSEDGVPPLVGRSCETVFVDGVGRLARLDVSGGVVRWVVTLTALDRRIHCGAQVTLRAVAGRGRDPVLGRGRARYRGRARAPIVVHLGRSGGRAMARHAIVEVELIAYGAAHGRCFQARTDPALYRIRL